MKMIFTISARNCGVPIAPGLALLPGLLIAALFCPASLAATFTVTNTLASGAGSLSNAIAQANAGTGTNTIAFNILPLDGTVKTITPATALPAITRPVIIDG